MRKGIFRLMLALGLGLTMQQALAMPQGGASSQQSAWQRVENKRVCMVTDMVFPRDQIPVSVSGKTYYGCCENCKERLGTDAAVRSATDPVSGKAVDKAKAVIAAGPDGGVQYFENEANMKSFIAKQK